MPSPRRLFRNFSTAQIRQLIDRGFDEALYGKFTSLSGAGKSSSIKDMDLETLLFEANYELDIRNETQAPDKIYMDLTGYK